MRIRLLSQLPQPEVRILLLHRLDHLVRRDSHLRHQVGPQPDPHRIVALADHRDIADPGHQVQLIDHVDVRIVADKRLIVAPLWRLHRHDDQDRRRLLRDRHPFLLHRLRQLRHRLVDLVLHIHLIDIRIRTDVKIDIQRHRPRRRVLRVHVDHVLDAQDLLFQRRRHIVRHRVGIGAIVICRYLDQRRRDVRVLLHRQVVHRHQPRKGDDQRNHTRKNRRVNKKPRDHDASPLPCRGNMPVWHITRKNSEARNAQKDRFIMAYSVRVTESPRSFRCGLYSLPAR